MIAQTCVDLANKVLSWKARALAAEEALSKFASEIYSTPPQAATPHQHGAGNGGKGHE